uniref:Uncharacterized protein n=1 Tax=Avena sativa TaxID=4498 RepID=A0ACD5XHV0_AVESA
MSLIRSHADRREKDMERIKSKMFCPLTPRRKIMVFPTVCKRTNCQCPPVAPPAESTSAIETCRTNIKWWESVMNWLQDKRQMIAESLGKDPEDLIVLSSGAECMKMSGGTVYHHRVPRQIIPRMKMRMPKGPPPSNEEEIQGVWKLFRDEQRELETCSLNETFYGPICLPDIKNPSSEDMFTIKEFFSAHQKSMVKHLDHLIYLQDVIGNHLIPQVRSKIRELIKELKFLQNPDLMKMHEWSYLGDMDPDKEPVDYLAPETEEDYPEQSDEEDKDTNNDGKA